MTSKNRYSSADADAAKSYLSKHIAPESDVYFLQRHSRTGARRYLRAFIAVDNQIICVTHAIARACDLRLYEHSEIVIDGGGFSATYEVTDSLSRVLFGKGGLLHDTAL